MEKGRAVKATLLGRYGVGLAAIEVQGVWHH
jgi:hypothetical protein